jgi:hypothetical protein
MPRTDAQKEASRLNGCKGRGPATPEGRSRSRANALKHGLTATVVIPGEDADAVQGLADDLHRQLNPATELGGRIVDLIARHATCLGRCHRAVDARTAYNVRHAQESFDDARFDAAQALYDALETDPVASVRRLSRTVEGVDCLARGWRLVLGALLDGAPQEWYRHHVRRIDALQGRVPGEFPVARPTALALAVGGAFQDLEDADGAGLDPTERRYWAKTELMNWVLTEMERLEALRDALAADPVLALDRAEAGERALFDPSAEAERLRRYAGRAERGIYQALREYRRVEAEAAATPDEEATCDAPGSFCPEAPGADPAPESEPPVEAEPLAAVAPGAGLVAKGSAAFGFEPVARPVAAVAPSPRPAAAGPRAG